MRVRNTGTADAEISHIIVNGTIIERDSRLSNADGLVIPIQNEAEVWVELSNPPYRHGTTAIITISTSQGNQYIQLVVIPQFGTG